MILEYDFRVVGANRVKSALAGIERRFVQHNSRVNAALGEPNKRRTRASSATDGIAAKRQLEDLARQRARAEQHVFRVRQRHFMQQQRAEERAEAALTRKRIANARAVGRIEAQQHRQAQLLAEREAKARQDFRRHTVGNVRSSVVRATKGVGAVAGGMLAIGGGMAATNAIQNQVGLNKRVQNLVVQSRAPGATSDIAPGDVKQRIFNTSIATGQSQSEVTAGLEKFVQRTGDLQQALKLLDAMGTSATAFDAAPEDIAAAMTDISEKFKIPAEQIGDMIAVIGAQGREASFELKDMASLLPRMAAAGERFGFTGEEGVRVLGGAAQIARRSTGSSEEAATALENALRVIIQKAPQIQSGEAFGRKVQVFEGGDPTKNARDYRAVVEDMIAASGGDITKISKAFDQRGVRAVSKVASAYRSASQAAGGGAAGEQAGREAIRKVFAEAVDVQASYSDVQKDAAEVLASGVNDLTIAQEKLNRALGEELTPAVIKLSNTLAENAPTIRRFADALASVAEFLIENPFKGIGAVIAGAVAIDIAKAKIAERISAALLGGGKGGGTVIAGGGAGGGAGKVAKGGRIGRALGGVASFLPMIFGAQMAQTGMNALTGEGQTNFRLGTAFDKEGDLSPSSMLDVGGMVQQNVKALSERTGGSEGHVRDVMKMVGTLTSSMPGLGGIGSAAQMMGLIGDAAGDAPKVEVESKSIDDAGNKMNTAADKIATAADRLNASRLNTGNSPTIPRDN